MIGNIKKSFPPKTWMLKSSFLQDPGYVGVVGEMRAALLHACRILIIVVGDIREGLNYIVYHNPNYLNWEILWINASNYSLLQIKPLCWFELETLRIKPQLNSLQIDGTSNSN